MSPTPATRSFGQPRDGWNTFQRPIPGRSARDKQVGVRSNRDVAVQASGRDNQQRTAHLQHWKRRSADGAERPAVPCRGQGELRDLVLTGYPFEDSCSREQVCGMRRTSVLAAMPAMAEIEALEVARHFESDRSTEARTGMGIQADHLPVALCPAAAIHWVSRLYGGSPGSPSMLLALRSRRYSFRPSEPFDSAHRTSVFRSSLNS